MNPDTLISVRHLTRFYGPNKAVDGVSFELKRGEVLGFLGPNGAGKSTTMQMVTGNLAPSAGEVAIGGIDLLERPREAKAHLGYLPEQPPVYRELTVDEYLRYCARLNRIPGREVGAAVARAKGRCGLDAVGGRLIGNLSKGYQQRVGIAQAIIHSPAVVVLDEPTVGLDPVQIREIRHLIKELGEEHGVILSTHILPEVQATCDRVQIIHRGRLVLADTIEGLAWRMDSNTLTVAFRRPPPLDALTALPGVQEALALEDGRFRLHHGAQASPAEALVEQSVSGDWGLFELIPERMSLEDIFVNITTREAAA